MAFTYQFGANPQIDYPRMMIFDTDSAHPIFQDSEIMAAYNIVSVFVITPNTGSGQRPQGNFTPPSYYRVAAILCDMLAANRTRLAGAVKVLDVQTDLSKAADAYRAMAKQYRDTEDNSGAFAIVEMVPNNYAAYERVFKQLLRLNQ